MIINSLILAVLFLVELAALGAFGYWGFHINAAWPAKIALGIGTPLLVAVFWGVFIAPKASIPVPAPVNIALKLAVFVLAAAALYAAGRSALAAAFLITALLVTALDFWLQL